MNFPEPETNEYPGLRCALPLTLNSPKKIFLDCHYAGANVKTKKTGRYGTGIRNY